MNLMLRIGHDLLLQYSVLIDYAFKIDTHAHPC